MAVRNPGPTPETLHPCRCPYPPLGMEAGYPKYHWIPNQVDDAPGACLFCDGDLSGNRAREHVFPQWLLRHYDMKGDQVRGNWMDALNNFKPKDVRTQSFSSMVHGHVCATCNNGWMSQLEEAVRPALLGLADDGNPATQLNAVERLDLARWITKTVAVLNHSSNYYTVVTREQARSARSAELVPGLNIFARVMPQPYQLLSWYQAVGVGMSSVPNGTDDAELMEFGKDAWRIIIVVGRVLLIASYVPPGPWLQGIQKDIHSPIWPLDGYWPLLLEEQPMELTDLPGEAVNATLSLGLVHDTLRDQYSAIVLGPIEPQ